MATMFAIFRRNQGSMPERKDSSSGVAPRRKAAISAQSRSSVGAIGRSSASSAQPFSSHSNERPPISSDRTAFCSDASNVRSMAITSPVAFICVPSERSPKGNLSNGHRGIFVTT